MTRLKPSPALIGGLLPGHAWLIAVLAFVLSWAPSKCRAQQSVEIFTAPLINPILRQIRFQLAVENPTGKMLSNQVVWFYSPVKRTATQQLQKLDVSIAHQLEEDELGNQIVKITLDQVPPYSTKLITIKADLLMSSEPSPSQLQQPAVYLRDEDHIEASDPLIRNLADQIKSSNVSATMAAAYHWVKSNLHYAGFIADDFGARYALVNKRGDCTEYAYLLTALARSNQILARTLGGYVMDRNGAPKADEYHNWTEVYIDGTWRLLDAQKENYQVNAEKYVVTRIVSSIVPNSLKNAHRFRVEGDITVRVN